jgi:hypothetical protein
MQAGHQTRVGTKHAHAKSLETLWPEWQTELLEKYRPRLFGLFVREDRIAGSFLLESGDARYINYEDDSGFEERALRVAVRARDEEVRTRARVFCGLVKLGRRMPCVCQRRLIKAVPNANAPQEVLLQVRHVFVLTDAVGRILTDAAGRMQELDTGRIRVFYGSKGFAMLDDAREDLEDLVKCMKTGEMRVLASFRGWVVDMTGPDEPESPEKN